MTLAQDAERLRRMADELCEIARRVERYVREENRTDPAYNVHGYVAGGCHGLRASATMLEELHRELNR